MMIIRIKSSLFTRMCRITSHKANYGSSTAEIPGAGKEKRKTTATMPIPVIAHRKNYYLYLTQQRKV
jgi:hypothetical protein